MSDIDTVSTDVLIIGGGPSGLATAIHLADTFKTKRSEQKNITGRKRPVNRQSYIIRRRN